MGGSGSGGVSPTDEQVRIVDAARSGVDMAVDALAGTGKTTTLSLIAGALRGRGQYLAFNKAIVTDSKAKFRSGVACNTAHSLAFKAIGHEYSARLKTQRVRSDQLAQHLKCRPLAYTPRYGSRQQFASSDVARMALATVTNFCKTADDELSVDHVALPAEVDERRQGQRRSLERAVLGYAAQVWDDIRRVDGVLPFNHDYYLKLWQLSSPRIPADFILFDEAQDADPVMLAIVEAQSAQRIYCGDPYQSIYEWRGAVNAMESVKVDRHEWLTHSFRFGPPIGHEANKLLDRLQSPRRIVPTKAVNSVVRQVSRPQVVLCRTNGGVLNAVLRALQLNLRPGIVGGVTDLMNLAKACAQLQGGQYTTHPDLAPFLSWDEVLAWVKEDRVEAGAVGTMVLLVEDFKVGTVLKALEQCGDESNADVIVSTVHRAKGREWDTVKFGADFLNVEDMGSPELRLAYVGVTRARSELDLTAWWDAEPLERRDGGKTKPTARGRQARSGGSKRRTSAKRGR